MPTRIKRTINYSVLFNFASICGIPTARIHQRVQSLIVLSWISLLFRQIENQEPRLHTTLSVVEYSLISIVGTLINDQGFALAACNIVNIIAKLSFYMSITSYQFVYLFFFLLSLLLAFAKSVNVSLVMMTSSNRYTSRKQTSASRDPE